MEYAQGVWTKHLQYYLDYANDAARTAKYSSFLGSQTSAVFHYGTSASKDVGSVWYAADQVSAPLPFCGSVEMDNACRVDRSLRPRPVQVGWKRISVQRSTVLAKVRGVWVVGRGRGNSSFKYGIYMFAFTMVVGPDSSDSF